MRIAMIGTRGVPARYGGFETAVEEIGARLVARGHEVRVYCRGDDRSPSFLGMERVRLPAMRHRAGETLSHSVLSVAHLLRTRDVDVAVVFNVANAPALPALRLARTPVAVHVDGLEWRRAKWGRTGRRYYRVCERASVGLADALIADADAIADHYRRTYAVEAVQLAYGAPILVPAPLRLAELDLQPRGYHLVVARIEPENHLDLVLEGYARSAARLPLVIVGGVPYPSVHERRVRDLCAADDRVRLLGGVWDQELLNALYSGAAGYIHGHSVGGTNPSLLRAMGAGASVAAWDVCFNREVLAGSGRYFGTRDELAALIEATEADPDAARACGRAAQDRAASAYRWDEVVEGYEQLCEELLAGTRSRRARPAAR